MYARDEYSSKYRPLSAIVPEQIEWLPSELFAVAMSITSRQLRHDVRVLKQLELIQLHEVEKEIQFIDPIPDSKRKRNYRCRRKGFNRQDAEIIWLFRQAVRERGRTLAIQSIYQITEDFYHDN